MFAPRLRRPFKKTRRVRPPEIGIPEPEPRIHLCSSPSHSRRSTPVGDIDGNLARIGARAIERRRRADLLCCPSWRSSDIRQRIWYCAHRCRHCHAAVDCLVRESHSTPALIATTPWREDGRVYNAAIVIDKGTTTRRFKSDLPNYGVFDEKRVFAPGPMPDPVNFRGIAIGVPVCEDIWTPAVTAHLARAGAEFFIVPNGSPFEIEKFPTRIGLARARARGQSRAVYVNQIGTGRVCSTGIVRRQRSATCMPAGLRRYIG